MADEDLGTAHGQVKITADVSGALEASAAMAGLNTEGKTLQGTLGKTTDEMSRQEKQSQVSAASLSNLQSKHEGLRQRMQETADAAGKVRQAQADLDAVMLNVSSTTEEQRDALKNLTQVKRDATEAEKAQTLAADAFRRAMDNHNNTVGKSSIVQRAFSADARESARTMRTFGQSLDEAGEKLQEFDKRKDHTRENIRGFRRDWEDMVDSIGKFVKINSTKETLQGIADTISNVRNATLGVLAGGGLAGGLGLLLGGGTEGLVGMVASMTELVGLVGLLPGLLAGAGAGVATLAVGFHGVAESIGAMGDPMKFVESLRELGPVTRQAMVEIHSFYASFRGAMEEVQDSIFTPILNDIQPLVMTYLPMLMHAGQEIGAVFGQAGHLFAAWLETPETVQTIQQFLHNVAGGLQAALPAVQAFSNAFLTISAVGGGFFQQIGESVAAVAKEFNAFISSAAQSGKLQEFIQYGIDSFKVLMTNIKDVSEALFNIFSIGNQYGGGFLELFRNIGQEFLNWTKSIGGQRTIADFFQTITEAGKALHPILREVGSGLATVVSSIVHLGTDIAPSINVFFKDLNDALKILGPALIQSAPAFSEFVEAMGRLVLGVVQALGPNLPTFLKNFADAAIKLVGPATELAGALGELLGKLTPKEIEFIIGAVGAFNALGTVIPIVTGAVALLANPVGLVVAGIAALTAGLVYFYENNDGFKEWVDDVNAGIDELPDALSKVPSFFESMWDTVTKLIKGWWGDVSNWGEKLADDFAAGIRSGLTTVEDAVKDMFGIPVSHGKPGSPTEEGPLSDTWSDTWGAQFSHDYASGIASGQGEVAAAASGVAGAAKDQFSTSGNTVAVGGEYHAGSSGFDQWIKRLTSDMKAVSNIAHEVISTGLGAASDVLKGVKLFAELWKGGVNPLTAPGGFDQGDKPLIPQAAYQGQFDVPNVPKASPYGQLSATDTTVPATGSGPTTGTYVPPSAKGPASDTPPTTPVAPTGGAVAPAGGQVGPTGLTQDQFAAEVINQAKAMGFNEEQTLSALGTGLQETGLGTNPRTNVLQNQNGTPDIGGAYQQDSSYDKYGNKLDPKVAIHGFLDQFRSRGQGLNNPNPWNQALRVQVPATVAGGGYNDAPSGEIGPGDYLRNRQRQNALGIYNRLTAGGAAPTSANNIPTRNASDYGGVALNDTEHPLDPGGGVADNPASQATRAQPFLGGSTVSAYDRARSAGAFTSPPLYAPGTDTGGYGHPGKLPAWMTDLGNRFGVIPSTYPEGGTLHQEGFATDWVAKPGDKDPAGTMDKFADFIMNSLMSQTMELIHANSKQGKTWGIFAGEPVGPGTKYPDYNKGDWAGHDDYGPEPHVHWATDVAPLLNGMPPQGGSPPAGGPGTGQMTPSGGAWLTPGGNVVTTNQQTNMPGTGLLPGGGTPGNGLQSGGGSWLGGQNSQQPGQSGGTWLGGMGQQSVPGVPQAPTQAPMSGMQIATQAIQGAGNIADSIFSSINSVIDSIGAGADLIKKAALLPKDTQTVISMVKDVQQFITTGAQIAQTTSSVLGTVSSFVGAGASADPSGGAAGAAAALGAASSIAGLVGDALSTVNMGITAGIDIYQQVTKYMGDIAGFTLGGKATGWLGGNVNMLLNTNNGSLYTYSQNDPLNKNVLNPGFQQAYDHTNAPQQLTPTVGSVNVYAGPGQTTQQMMSDTMWMVGTGAPSVVSAAGKT
jgi:hypothetical protein